MLNSANLKKQKCSPRLVTRKQQLQKEHCQFSASLKSCQERSGSLGAATAKIDLMATTKPAAAIKETKLLSIN